MSVLEKGNVGVAQKISLPGKVLQQVIAVVHVDGGNEVDVNVPIEAELQVDGWASFDHPGPNARLQEGFLDQALDPSPGESGAQEPSAGDAFKQLFLNGLPVGVARVVSVDGPAK